MQFMSIAISLQCPQLSLTLKDVLTRYDIHLKKQFFRKSVFVSNYV